jgi:DNA polymerase-4
MHSLGIMTISDLSAYPQHLLETNFGKYGEVLKQKAVGNYAGAVHHFHEAKSISTEHTFSENTADLDFLQAELLRMTEKLGHELREDGKMTQCVAVKIRYPDFETHTRQMAISPTSYDDELIKVVKDLFGNLYKKNQLVRLVGVRFSELTLSSLQTDLFENRVRKANLYTAIDAVKQRFGKKSLGRGR